MDLRTKLTSTPDGLKLYQREWTKQIVTDLVCIVMNQVGMSRSVLADKIGWDTDYLDKWLDGQEIITTDDVSDLLTAMGYQISGENFFNLVEKIPE